MVKQLDQESVVRVWRNVKQYKVLPTSHFGHAAITIRGSLVPSGDQYISWWPGEGAGKKDAFRAQSGSASDGYEDDKVNEMNKLTAIRLEIGYRRSQTPQIPVPPEWDELLRELGKGPISAPRPGQQRLGREMDLDGFLIPLWSQSADEKINIPGIGATGSYWGLSTRRMAEWWTAWKDRNPSYQLASSTNSCAGAAALALKAGGGEAFAKAPSALIYMEPLQIQEWANQILVQVDRMNEWTRELKSEFLSALSNKSLAPGISPPPPPGDLWSAEAWKKDSAVTGAPRSSIIREIDSCLEKFHGSDWAKGFEEKYRLLAKIFLQIVLHRKEKPDSKRKTSVLRLGNQVVLLLIDPRPGHLR